MPVQNIEFVVHHCIDCLFDQSNWQKVTRSVDQYSAVLKQWFIFDFDWQCDHKTLFVITVAGNRLQESLESSNEPNIMFRLYSTFLLCNSQIVTFLFRIECTFQSRIHNLYFNHHFGICIFFDLLSFCKFY